MYRTSALTITIFGLAATASADQLCVPQPYATIQSAIASAEDGDEVLVSDGTYYEAIDFLGKAITVRSVNGPQCTVIDATGLEASAVKCVSYESFDTVLQGFTLTGGAGTVEGSNRLGGGMCIRIAGPTVRDCVFVDNTADIGGGLGCLMSWASVSGCVFLHNTATGGGDWGGGGMAEQGGDPSIVDCAFIENASVSTGKGGGLNLAGSDAEVVNCVFYANDALYGGAVANIQGEPTLINCTFSQNTAFGAYQGLLNLCSGAQATLVNCIFWGNGGDAQGGEIASACGAAESIVAYCDVEGGWDGPGEGNVDADPMFVDAATGDLHLTAQSPCIDTGDSDAFLQFGLDCDLDGNPRPVDGPAGGGNYIVSPQWHTWRDRLDPRVDMGAYEVQP
jgi:hypothetical protein